MRNDKASILILNTLKLILSYVFLDKDNWKESDDSNFFFKKGASFIQLLDQDSTG